MTARTIRLAGVEEQGRITSEDELHAVRLAEDFEDLAIHNPEAIRLAALVIKAMQDRANGHTPDIRVDRQIRHRQLQLSGEKRLPLVDVVAIALENDLGREVALDGLRVLVGALGYSLAPLDARPADVLDASADLMVESAAASAALVRDARDGQIDQPEAHRANLAKVESTLADIKAAITPRIEAHRRSRA